MFDSLNVFLVIQEHNSTHLKTVQISNMNQNRREKKFQSTCFYTYKKRFVNITHDSE